MKRPFYHSSATLFLSNGDATNYLTKALLPITISTIILFIKIYFVPQTTRAFNLFEKGNHFRRRKKNVGLKTYW